MWIIGTFTLTFLSCSMLFFLQCGIIYNTFTYYLGSDNSTTSVPPLGCSLEDIWFMTRVSPGLTLTGYRTTTSEECRCQIERSVCVCPVCGVKEKSDTAALAWPQKWPNTLSHLQTAADNESGTFSRQLTRCYFLWLFSLSVVVSSVPGMSPLQWKCVDCVFTASVDRDAFQREGAGVSEPPAVREGSWAGDERTQEGRW